MSVSMKKQQLIFLFFVNIAILFVGMGVFPVLPLYAMEFGAKPSFVGIYLAITYLSITAGSLLTGYLVSKIGARALFLWSGLLGIPALAFMGYANSLWQVVFLTSAIWFIGGIGVGLAGVFTGLYADKNSRGKTFSLQSLSSPISAIIGGGMVGYLLDVTSYQAMFLVTAAVWSIWPVLALWKIRYEVPFEPPKVHKAGAGKGGSPSGSFITIMVITLLAALTVNASRLGLSISMESLGFSAGEISSTTIAGGIASIPAIFLIGSFADRWGRVRFIALGLLLTVAGSITLLFADRLWHFWAASAFLLVSMTTNGSVTSAFVTDVLPAASLSNKLPQLNTMRYVASIISFGGAGYAMEIVGLAFLYGAAAVLPIAGVLLTARLVKVSQGTRENDRVRRRYPYGQTVPCQ